MCKIMALAGVTEAAAKDKLWRFAVAASKHLSAASDKDGFGYAAADANGALFGERWLDNSDAFIERTPPPEDETKRLAGFGDSLWRTVKFNRFGSADPDATRALILHARFATCDRNIENTHPFVADNTALIHNGVISNAQMLKNKTSTCDSEVILHSYLEAAVGSNPGAIQQVADEVFGTYACAVLGTDDDGVAYMDIFKNKATGLVCAHVKELGATVFCTTLDILEKTCKEVGMTLSWSYWVKPSYLLRLSVKTGEVLKVVAFDEEGSPPPGGTPKYSPVAGQAARALMLAANKRHPNMSLYHEEHEDDKYSDEDLRDLYMRGGVHY